MLTGQNMSSGSNTDGMYSYDSQPTEEAKNRHAKRVAWSGVDGSAAFSVEPSAEKDKRNAQRYARYLQKWTIKLGVIPARRAVWLSVEVKEVCCSAQAKVVYFFVARDLESEFLTSNSSLV